MPGATSRRRASRWSPRASCCSLIRRTKLGLGLRATALDAERSRGLGLNVDWLATFAWGVATAVGAVAGVLAAPAHGVDPSMLRAALLYALAAAVIGGIDSPGGAVLGGLVVGVGVQLLGAYVHWVGSRPPSDVGVRRAARRPARPAVGRLRPAAGGRA